MKKRLTASLLGLLQCAALAGCGENKSDGYGVTLSAKNVTADGMTLVCTQKGGDYTGTLEWGSEYRLQAKNGENWADVPMVIDNGAWDTIAYYIPTEQTSETEINWKWLYGSLNAGVYRLEKNIMDFHGVGGEHGFQNYYVEFEIA